MLDDGLWRAGPQGAFSVSEIAAYLRASLQSDPTLADLWVSGEVSNFRKYASGHGYFSLRDAESSLRCVMFRGGRGGQFLDDGAQVVAHGNVSFYPARGELQLYVDQVRPEGVGALQAAFEKLKRALEEEGLFEPSRKRALPRFPGKIAIVTSPSGSVLHDILNVLRRRYPLAEVSLAPTAVQGAAAAPAIVEALSRVDAEEDIDVAILARGGGSLEDLWAFNEEAVARAVFASRIPVVSGVGHETDVTIADLVADVRAPTPSAAAEIVAPNRSDLLATIREHVGNLDYRVQRILTDRKTNLNLSADRLAAAAPDTRTPRERIDELLRLTRSSMNRTLERHRDRLNGLEFRLKNLGPGEVLGRGYAIVRRQETGNVLSSADQTEPGDALEITLANGHVSAETTRISLDERHD